MKEKVTSIDSISALGPIYVFNFSDKSKTVEQSFGAVSLCNRQEQRKAARALSPVYVVKTNKGYASQEIEGWLDHVLVDDQKQATRFTSKKRAKKLVEGFAGEINARVVRLK